MNTGAADRATSGQQKASDPAASAWVSANAGSGKTHVLANRVIRLLLAGTDPGKILCLTFTRAAAAEMSNRIFDTLGQWVTLDEDELIRRIHGVSGVAQFDADRLVQARRLFARALETPGGLKVQTIHAFCESLLQRFPLEADVSPGFEVLEERGAQQLLVEARAAILGAAASDGAELNAALRTVVARLQPADFDTVLSELLSKRRESTERISPPDIAARLRALHGLDDDDTSESIAHGALGGDGDRERYASSAGVLRGSGSNDQKTAARIERFLNTTDWHEAFIALLDVFFTASLTPRKDVVTKGFAKQHAGIADWLGDRQAMFESAYERYKAAVVCASTEALVSIADAVIARYEARKRHRGLLDYDDLIHQTLRLFTSSSAAWVLFKLDGGLDHILVDEAQDTSPEQWQIISRLAEEFFSGEGARGMVRTVFAVGDEKQSIFSFQGADPAQFDEMRNYFRRHVERARKPFESVPLTVSFRSTSMILDAVDRVFQQPGAAKGLTQSGTAPPHEANRSGQPGMVEIWPTLVPEDSDDDDDPWYAPLDRERSRSPRARLAEQIAETVAGWLRDGEILASRDRPVRAGDILILVRRRNAFVDAVVRELKSRNVPVAGADRLVLTDHIAVMDLLALARFVLLPEDDLTLATLLKSPLISKADGSVFDDVDLFTLAYDRGGSLWEALTTCGTSPQLSCVVEQLTAWRARADRQRPYEFFAQVLGTDEGRRRFIERLGAEANDPIDEFLGLALQYERQNLPSLQGFVEWTTAADTQIKRDMEHGVDEVRVMTVHGAKGLEANIVFLPDTCTMPNRMHDPKVIDLCSNGSFEAGPIPVWPIAKAYETKPVTEARELLRARQHEEYNRLLYVAMTRACDRLYVCGYETKRGRDKGCWYDMICEALAPVASEIATGDEAGPRLRLEDPGAGATESDKKAQATRPVPEAPPDWARSNAPPAPPAQRTLAPSRLELVEEAGGGETVALREQPVVSPLAGADGDRFKRGQLIHTLLQMLPDLPADERRARAVNYLAQTTHGLSDDEQAEIESAVLSVLEHPDYALLFGPDSRAEVPIAGRIPVKPASGDDIVISGQVDRLVVAAREVLIVDYKTNRPAAPSVDRVAPLYVRQLAAYRLALAALFPEHEVRAYLLWTDGPDLMEIPAAAMQQALPTIP